MPKRYRAAPLGEAVGDVPSTSYSEGLVSDTGSRVSDACGQSAGVIDLHSVCNA